MSSPNGNDPGVVQGGPIVPDGLPPGPGGEALATAAATLGPRRLLEVIDLRTGFKTPRGRVRAVDGVSLTLDRGRTLGIVGESGSGKTVLSRSIMGLLPKRNVIREGQVLYEGVDLVTANPDAVRDLWGAEMAMIFQDPMTSLNPVQRLGAQITEGMRYHLGMDRKTAMGNALSLLREVGIPEPDRRVRQYPHELSGGMRQRVMIAVALACGPKLVFADEPTTALDVTIQAQILNLLQSRQRERDMAMILVTHDLGVVAGRTDDIAVMYAGEVVEKAPTTQLFRNVRMPYTEALLKSIPVLDAPSHSRLQAIPGRPPDLVNPPPGCRFAPRCTYVQDKCRTEHPPLLEGDTGHWYRCWFPVGHSTPVTVRAGQAPSDGGPGGVV
ncbi:MAG TPA: ABC transporter ATP-binding protein [Acidimicrobiales bacterium]|nr:ABC transporter ATP-binding protein [Acidimicrobiales bacterium]